MVLTHCVVEEWDPGRTTAYIPFHFDGFNLILYYLSPKIVKVLPQILIFSNHCCITPCQCKDKIHRYHDRFQLITIPMQSLS